MAETFRELSMENRGLAWSIGGQWNWRNATTLPNILKEFNPSVLLDHSCYLFFIQLLNFFSLWVTRLMIHFHFTRRHS